MASYASLLSLEKEVKKKTSSSANGKTSGKKKPTNDNKGTKRSRSRSPRSSSNRKKMPTVIQVPKEEEIYINWDIPDRQYGDLYCKPCDSHMNSELMWEAHIQGKRHLKTVKKGETAEPRYVYVDEDPSMIKQLEEETRPIVGLQHLVEIQRLEQRPTYQCFLCSGNLPSPEQLIEHIVGTKHRLAYLKEHDRERYDLIQNSNLKKGHIEPVVEECIEKHERDQGRGKMLVKREKEVSGEQERGYNNDYSYSRNPRGQNKPGPSKPKSFRNNDFDSSSESSHKNNRNKDWDCGRSTHSNRSYDGYPDDYDRGKPKDKEDYYRRSPERSEIHSRSAYPARRSPDLRSPEDDEEYRKIMAKKMLSDERCGYLRHTPERERYASYEPERYQSIPQAASTSYHRPRPDDTYGDLREILEKKKTTMDPYSKEINISDLLMGPKDTLPSSHNQASYFSKNDTTGNNFMSALINTSSASIPRVKSTLATVSERPDDYLELIESMSTSVFLQLAYFKVNRLDINTESELRLLDKLSTRITALSMKIKANQLPTNLQNQFRETMVQSGLGLNPQFSKDFEQMMEMVGQVKASSNLGGGNPASQPAYSTPTFVSSNAASSSSGYQSWSQNDPTPQSPLTNRSSWLHMDANSSQQSNHTQLETSSSAPSIPGLDFGVNQSNDTTTSFSSPFDVLNNYAKEILGGSVKQKADSYRY